MYFAKLLTLSLYIPRSSHVVY